MKTKSVLITISDELLRALDAAKGDSPRAGFIESQLWRSPAVKKAAAAAGIENPQRAADGRGTWSRRKRRKRAATR